MAVRYGTPKFLLRTTVRFFRNGRLRYVGTVRLFCKDTGTVRWYALKIKTPDFLHIAPAFCIQKQKTAETDAKWVN